MLDGRGHVPVAAVANSKLLGGAPSARTDGDAHVVTRHEVVVGEFQGEGQPTLR